MNNAAGTRCRTKKRGFPTAERVLQLDLLHSCCRELESIDPATLLQSPWEIASRGGSVLTRPKRKMSWQRRTSVQTPLRSKKKSWPHPLQWVRLSFANHIVEREKRRTAFGANRSFSANSSFSLEIITMTSVAQNFCNLPCSATSQSARHQCRKMGTKNGYTQGCSAHQYVFTKTVYLYVLSMNPCQVGNVYRGKRHLVVTLPMWL